MEFGDEIWLFVFSYLDFFDLCQVAQVCTRFNRLTCDQQLYRHVQFREKHIPLVSDSVMQRVVARGGSCIRMLWLAKCWFVTDDALRCVAQHCPQLERLSLESCNVTSEGVALLARSCPKLQQIVLNNGREFANDALVQFALHCPNVMFFSAVNCDLDSGVLEQAICNWPQLVHLDIRNNPALGDTTLSELAQHCPQLEYVNFCGCPQASSTGIAALARGCKQLQFLDLNECGRITRKCLSTISTHSTRLRWLNLSCCFLLSAADISAAVMRLPHLIYLNLSACHATTDITLGDIANHCPHLQILDISECPQITDAGVELVLRGCPELSCLSLQYCTNVSQERWQELPKRYPKLRYLTQAVVLTSPESVCAYLQMEDRLKSPAYIRSPPPAMGEFFF